MNDKNFDSFIKQSLNGHNSTVPADMWKRIQAMKDFDPFVKENLNKLNSPVPADMWQRITDEKDFDTHIRQNLDNISSPVPADMWGRIQHEKDFDATIKQKLDNHASPVPADMWQRIHPEEKKRRPFIWWAVAASLLLMVGAAGAWYFNQPHSSSNIAANNKPSANGPQPGNTITALPSHSGGSVTSSQGHDSLTIPNANNTASQSNTNQTDNQSSTPQNKISKTVVDPNKTTAAQNPSNQTNNNGTGIFSSNNGNKFFSGSNKNSSNSNFVTGKNKNNVQNATPQNSLADASNNGSPENDQLLNSTSNAFSNNEKTLQLKSLIRTSLASNKMLPKQLMHVNAKMPSIVCPTLGPPARNDWYIEAFVSPNLVQKNLTDKPASANIKKGMDSTLHGQVSFSAGVNIVKNIGENFLVKTGVQYSQVNELFKTNSGSDTRTTTVITVRDVIVSPGDTIHIRDTSTVQTTGTITKQTQNHYRQWDIPLIFGYEFGGSGLRINANVGLIANIRSSYQGNMLDTAQKIIDIASYNNTGIYKTNIGLGAYLGLAILKPLNDNVDLIFEPHAQINLSSMTTQAAIFNQKNSIFGLSVGIRYKLNGNRQRY